MQTSNFLNQEAVEQSNFKRVEIIEVESKSAPLTQLPTRTVTDFKGGFLFVSVVFVVIASVLSCVKGFKFPKGLSNKLNTIKRSHRIPCSTCRFYNNDPFLKCAVHPSKVLSEEACDCPDYCLRDNNKFFH